MVSRAWPWLPYLSAREIVRQQTGRGEEKQEERWEESSSSKHSEGGSWIRNQVTLIWHGISTDISRPGVNPDVERIWGPESGPL